MRETNNGHNQILVVLLTGLVALVWGLVFLVMDILLDDLDPMQILAFRWLLAAVTMLLLAAFHVFPLQFTKENIWYLLAIGVVQALVYPLSSLFGLSLTSASILSVFESLIPGFSVILGALFFGKKTNRRGICSIVLVFAGVIICTVFASDFSAEGRFLGYSLVLISVIAHGLYSQMAAKAGETVNALTISTAMCLVGCAVHNIDNFAFGYGFETYKVILSDWHLFAGVFFLAVVSSILAFTAYSKAMALAKNPGLAANISGGLSTVIGVAAGIALRGDESGLYTIVGVIVILAGVFFSSKQV